MTETENILDRIDEILTPGNFQESEARSLLKRAYQEFGSWMDGSRSFEGWMPAGYCDCGETDKSPQAATYDELSTEPIRVDDVLVQFHCPPCPECGDSLTVPRESHPDFTNTSPRDAICSFCGHQFTVDNDEDLAALWFGYGGFEALRDAGAA